jgi:glutamate formiminotransferase/formiminotetrahydrofolate cyclodeaminase
MSRLVECVPNFSEGRNAEVVEALVRAIVSVPGNTLLDREMDRDHHRCVLTFVGDPDSAVEGAYRAMVEATRSIDLNRHQGEHPRMGATDVIPFIPIRGIGMEDCIQLARRLGERVGKELEIPVYLYEEAATRPSRRNLADVRRGEFEGLRDRIGKDPERDPDFGPKAMHATAGAVAIGARMPLVAYNVYLGTKDLSIAKRIAKAIRHSDGGLRYVKALGFAIEDRGIVQISMNLVNTQGSPIHRVFALIRSEAARYGVAVLESEVVGLVGADPLFDVAEHHLQLNRFDRSQILENRLEHPPAGPGTSLGDFLDRLASDEPTPGGGSAAALSGSLAAALLAMVAGLSLRSKKLANDHPRFREIAGEARGLRATLDLAIEEDARAFEDFLRARRLPEGSDREAAARRDAIRNATIGAALVPMKVVRASARVLELLVEVAAKGNPNAISDVGVAARAAATAVDGAGYNVRINLKGMESDPEAGALGAELRELAAGAAERAKHVLREVEAKI